MRYTLRLLTIQQFQRAATLLCACKVLRREASDRLGRQPFSIGLWVGGGATPNHIDQKPDRQHGREPGALQALENFDQKNEPAEGNLVQIRTCPWCGEAIAHTEYRASKELLHLQIRCREIPRNMSLKFFTALLPPTHSSLNGGISLVQHALAVHLLPIAPRRRRGLRREPQIT
jgi:hypothetical protein